ncbi:MAG: NAD-dependent epimerase/dehydratase family protein [Candidatus Coatesbacteria bacterium]
MRILVTGGAGFIGSHVAEAFLAAGHEVTVLDWEADKKRSNIPAGAKAHNLDIRSPEVARVFEAGRFDVVSHHAAQVSVSYSVREAAEDASINLLGVLNLLELTVKHGVKKFLHASSGGTVYGPTVHLPAAEDLPFDATSPYGVSKVATELYLRVYSMQRGLKFTALRYSNVYGPRQDAHGEAGVVAIFTEKMLTGGKPVICGDGEYIRDYVYVGDVARASVLALDKGEGEGINIGTGVRTSTNALFRCLAGLAGFRGPESHGPDRPGDLRESYLAIAKAKRVLGWEPTVRLEEGLGLTVDWFRQKVGA